MIYNYLKIAFRNLSRHKSYAAINLSGLSIGIAAGLLLFLVIGYEYGYDKFQKNYSSIYHIVTQDKLAGRDVEYNTGLPFPALDALRADLPDLTFSPLYSSFGSQITVLKDEQKSGSQHAKFIEDNGLLYTDPSFFKVFNYTWLAGAPSVLAEPNKTVLTREKAEKYFGSWQTAMGKSLLIDNATTVVVSGIIETPPAQTDFPLQILASYETFKNIRSPYGYSNDWGHVTSNFQLFTVLPANLSPDLVNKKLEAFSARQYKPNKRRIAKVHFLHPLSEIHFDSRFDNLGDHVISRATLKVLSFIGMLIIVMACINFVNLATAKSVSRSKEVGVRKVLGGSRPQLFAQMMGETALIVFLSIVIALVLAYLALPYLKNFVSIREPINLFNSNTVFLLLTIGITVTLLSGLYPAMVLSGFRPALALKNKISASSIGGISLRRALVVLQFAISQILVIGTIIAISQMNFIRNDDIGFEKEAVLLVHSNSDSVILSRQEAFKAALLQIPSAKAVSFSSDVPSSDNNSSTNFAFDMKPDEDFMLFMKFADADYFKTFGLTIVAGRGLNHSDTVNEVVINETLVKKLGLKTPEEALGKSLRTGGGPWTPVVGVVKDFKTNSLREDIKPLMIASRTDYYSVTAVKLHSKDMARSQAAVQETWDRFFPEYANTSLFMDESIDRFYEQEKRLSDLYKVFAALAIIISCLGLYGLVSFLVIQKSKEVGVRKVLGASVSNIVVLFSREFTILVCIAFLIAAPISWYVMNDWLNNFQFKVNPGVGVFLLAILISLFVAWTSVGYKAVRAALANPVDSIRNE